ncbi:hypothetical protein EDB85DRAFT_2277285 [Lactarius pseudohatsudake]|nr:hypothetical protein EDB85DRAFT_2277285 [Lactarius pseudohatsudake]
MSLLKRATARDRDRGKVINTGGCTVEPKSQLPGGSVSGSGHVGGVVSSQWVAPHWSGPALVQAYIKLEIRYNELDRASAIYERWVAVRPEPRVWVKWGKFEEERGKVDKARDVFRSTA